MMTVVHEREQPFQDGAHADIVNTYPVDAAWSCRACGRRQGATVYRFLKHTPARCRPERGPDSACYHGPYCPHCAEGI